MLLLWKALKGLTDLWSGRLCTVSSVMLCCAVQVALGFIGSSAQAGLAEKLGATGKESKVVSVCNGDLRTAEAFTGVVVAAAVWCGCSCGCLGEGGVLLCWLLCQQRTGVGVGLHSVCMCISCRAAAAPVPECAACCAVLWRVSLCHGNVQAQIGAAAAAFPECAACCAVLCACVAVFQWQFAGKLKSEPLQRHINAYAAGKKCAAQVGVELFDWCVSLRWSLSKSQLHQLCASLLSL